VNCCTIDWFAAWPREALQGVARHFLDSVDLEISTRDGIVEMCVDMQQRVGDMSAVSAQQIAPLPRRNCRAASTAM
jgi:dynein heavy chain, axonemal